MLRTGSIATVAAVALVASPALGVFIDFDNEGDLAANFTIPAGNTTAETFTEAVSGGVGDSRAVRPRNFDATAVYNPSTFGLEIGEVFVNSMFIHKVSATGATSRMLQLGLATSAAGGNLFTDAAIDFVSARVDTAASASEYVLVVQHRLGASLSTSSQVTPFTLESSRLYQFTVEIERTGEDTFAVAGSLVDYGADGLTPGATIASFEPVTVTNASVGAAAGALHAGFRSGYDAGAHRLDNYSAEVIPEPAGAAALLLGGVALIAGRRR